MNTLKTFVESLGNFKTAKLESGLMRIHAHNDKFVLGLVCNESCVSGSVRTKDGNTLYQTKKENISLDDVKSKISELCNMYSKACSAFMVEAATDDKKDDKKSEDETDDKDVLLSDKSEGDKESLEEVDIPGAEEVNTNGEVIVNPAGSIVASAEGELNDNQTDVASDNATNDATDESIEEASEAMSDFNEVQAQLVVLADTTAKLVSDLKDADPESKLIATGLSSQLYNIALDVKSFIDNYVTKVDTEANLKSAEVKESVAVPAKTTNIDIARGGINKARIALSKSNHPEVFGNILEMLADINSELITQF